MAAITPAEAPPASTERDIEKHVSANQDANEVFEDPKTESDDSEHKQDGVKQVEAITTVWSNKSLWTTFVL